MPAPSRPAPGAGLAGPAGPPAAGDPDIQRLPQPDWLPHRLTVAGPAEALGAFRAAAAGAGVVPWRLDDAAAEAGWLALMLAVPPHRRGIGAAGARILAGRLRDAWLARNEAATARVGRARDCPLDLHALVPVPDAVLALGPEDPAALRWLWEHWGTTWPLRQVRRLDAIPDDGRRRPAAVLAYAFHAADWSPWQALRRLRRDWPALAFDLRPDYG